MLKRPFNIFKDEAFAYSNKVLDSVLIAHKKAGEEPQVRHKAAITEEDLEKLKGYFADVLDENSPNAMKLCEYCWFIIACHFCLRASEIQASPKKEDVVFNQKEHDDQCYQQRFSSQC